MSWAVRVINYSLKSPLYLRQQPVIPQAAAQSAGDQATDEWAEKQHCQESMSSQLAIRELAMMQASDDCLIVEPWCQQLIRVRKVLEDKPYNSGQKFCSNKQCKQQLATQCGEAQDIQSRKQHVHLPQNVKSCDVLAGPRKQWFSKDWDKQQPGHGEQQSGTKEQQQLCQDFLMWPKQLLFTQGKNSWPGPTAKAKNRKLSWN